MIRQVIRHWLPVAAVSTALCLLTYLVSQQVLRLTGNDPQIQLAQDAADRLIAGEPASSIVPAGTLDVSRSLAPFIIIYDDQRHVLATNGQLHGQPPTLPSGVFDYLSERGEDRISWQPEPGVRFAAVVVRVGGAHAGWVLAARSLRETELREMVVEQLAMAVWLGTLVVSLALAMFVEAVVAPRESGG